MQCHRLAAIVTSMLVCLLHATAGGVRAEQPAGGRVPAGARPTIPEDLRQRIETAIPDKSIVRPIRPRRLLVFTRNVGYGGHASIEYANLAIARMGDTTGAFQAVISDDPAMFAPESLKHFDAVFFNNNVGNLFADEALRTSLVDFIYSGGGMLGVHGATVAFTVWPGAKEDWPEFGRMIGARGANHRDSDERVFVRLDDPDHPLNSCFPREGFEFRDEFFRVHDPYSRDRLRVLLSIDTERTDLSQGYPRGQCERADNDYALAWVRHYGRGRVFYCTIAHNPYVFWDPTMLRFYLGAIQFALGDLAASTTPSGQLTPAARAAESLRWRLAVVPATDSRTTLFDMIDLAAASNVRYLSATWGQPVSNENEKPFDPQLTDDDRRQIRLKLDDAGVRLLSCRRNALPDDEADLEQIFRFAAAMGIETLVVRTLPQKLDTVRRLSGEHGVRLSVPVGRRGSSNGESGKDGGNAQPDPEIGTCVDLAAWINSGTEPSATWPTPADRLTTVQIPGDRSLAGISDESFMHRFDRFLSRLPSLSTRPIDFEIETTTNGTEARAAILRRVKQFAGLCVKNASTMNQR